MRDELAAAVADGSIFAVRSDAHTLTLYCYTRRCMYEGRWTPLTMAARGLILDDDGTIVCRPIPKFFSLHEPHVPGYPIEQLEAEPMVVLEKLDGSLVNAWHYGDAWRLSTKGSFQSSQCALAMDVAVSQHPSLFHNLDPAYTYGFELIHPANRIIVDYGARQALVLLCARHTATGDELPWETVQEIARSAGVPTPQVWTAASLRTLALPDGFQEGVVAWFPRLGHRVKVKRPEYLQAHRVLSGLGPRMILDLMETQRLDEVRTSIPPQHRDAFDDVAARVRADATTLHERVDVAARLLVCAEAAAMGELGTRKAQALWIQQHAARDLHALLYATLDRKPLAPIIAKMLRARYAAAPAAALIEDDA